MAFASPSAIQGLAASSVDMLPHISSTLSLPMRLLGRQQVPASTKPPKRTKSLSTTAAASTPSAGPTLVNKDARAAFSECFEHITPSQLRQSPTIRAIKADHSIRSIFANGGGHTARFSPIALQNPSSFRASRGFSTFSQFGPFKLRPISSNNVLKSTQSRGVASGQSSHNLLAHMEQTANNNPSSASAQNAFYSALLRANMPEILVERYETGRYATNSACDAMYHRALERLGQSGGGGAESATAIGAGARGFSPSQLQSVSRAVAASVRGGSTASARRSGSSNETGEKSNPLHVVVDEPMGFQIFKIFKFLMIWGLTGYFLLIVTTLIIDATGSMRRVGGSQNAEVKAEQQKARFTDVQGCDEAKEELQEIVDFLQSPDKYNKLGGKLPKGVLMVGPPGTGKTLLARAVAGEAGVPFFYMSGSEFDEVYVGVGAKRVRELFSQAKAKAPAIVFIDELDAVGGKRNERDAAYHMQTLNQMLTELDGFDQQTGVVFIGATNFPQMLDKALTRPGRFDRQVVVPLPDVRGRVAILKHHMKNMQISTEVDEAVLARGTPGFSGADLENLVNQAAVHASKAGSKKVGMLDLDWARDRIIMGAEKKSMVITDKEKRMTAYHEAGHALVSMFTKGSYPLYKCTIMPRGMALGLTHSMPDMDKHSQSKTELLAMIDMAMGGKAAEEIVYGTDQVTSGCSSDLTNATNVALEMVSNYGMSDTLGAVAFGGKFYNHLSSETKRKIEDEVRKYLDEGQDRARKLLREKRKELDRLAEALIKYETLDKEEMEKVIRGESLPDKLQAASGVPIKVPELPIPGISGQSGTLGGSGDSQESDSNQPVQAES